MFEKNAETLKTVLKQCAAEMQRRVITKLGTNRVQCLLNDRREWRGPPLAQAHSYAGIDLQLLSKLLYQPFYVIRDSVEIWNSCVDALHVSRGAARRAQIYFPGVPFVNTPPAAPLVQALCVMWWCNPGSTLTASKNAAWLKVNGEEIGLDQRTSTFYSDLRRLPRGCAVSPTAVLSAPTGRARAATAQTTAVYRMLVSNFPSHVAEFDVIFATAVAAGAEYQEVLTELFDIVTIDIEHKRNPVWVSARKIVDEAVGNPCKDLWALLRGTLTLDIFVSKFGNPHRGELPLYTPLLRKRHTAAIDLFESGEINSAVVAEVGDHLKAANDLLNFQQMIGRA